MDLQNKFMKMKMLTKFLTNSYLFHVKNVKDLLMRYVAFHVCFMEQWEGSIDLGQILLNKQKILPLFFDN